MKKLKNYGARKLSRKEMISIDGGTETYPGGCNYSGGGSQCNEGGGSESSGGSGGWGEWVNWILYPNGWHP